MKTTQKLMSLTLAALTTFVVACGDDNGNNEFASNSLDGTAQFSIDDGVHNSSSNNNSANNGGGTVSTAGALRLRCEKRSNRSKISVDASGVVSGTYYATASSNGVEVRSANGNTIGDEVEFDFDSDSEDIAAGATAISPNFINGPVTGAIYTASGALVKSGTLTCINR